jgi:3-oxoacyl-[acyl-carrier protein] reductase
VAGRSEDPALQDEALALTTERLGPPDLLVNNVGINPVFGPLLDLDLDAARKIFEVNVLATLSWVQKTCRAGLLERGGAIVNLSSVAGLRPARGIGFYGATKALLIQLTAQLAVELGPTVRVNAVAPAIVTTRFAEGLYVGREAELAAQYPLRRLGVPQDIASVVAFLLSDDAAWVTGELVTVDGGLMVTGGV